jgi:crotonobetainyl-CoA:carnitine CoA-transferase CaiB-like acyl-CoA transferase
MESFGLGYAAVQPLNPRLIFCSISGYGHTGPDAELPGYDLIIQGEGGIASLTGDPNGPPYKVGSSQADIIAGMMGFQGILLALLARARTGQGQKVDIGMLDCQVAMLTYQAGIYFATGETPTRMGNQHPTITPYETYRCQDGYINLACGNDSMWRRFCKAVGQETWTDDSRFRSNADRVQHRRQLSALLEPVMLQKTAQEWIETLRGHDIPCGRIQSVRDVCDSPQIQARDMVVSLDHPKAGSIRVTGVPIKLSTTPGAVTAPPPLLGEHTAQVLTDWLHLSSAAEDLCHRQSNDKYGCPEGLKKQEGHTTERRWGWRVISLVRTSYCLPCLYRLWSSCLRRGAPGQLPCFSTLVAPQLRHL